jgi:aconitate hydratase 2/2-methylisocitrate dehydratase
MEAWLANPELMEPDEDAEYFKIIEIDLNEIREPLLACPNDPDDIKPLSAVHGTKIDEVFIGSCMTNIGHFRAASEVLKQLEEELPTKLWIAPPTKMDEHQLTEEGVYNIFGVAGARTEMPGCSLCMGNQARVAPNSTVVSTSTRNFPNRLGQGADVFLASSELAAVSAALGKIPTIEEYMTFMEKLDTMSGDIYQYLNFNQIQSYVNESTGSKQIALTQVQELA